MKRWTPGCAATSARRITSPAPARWGRTTIPWRWLTRRLRVRGVAGLRVADASIMPDVVRANTNVTTMMIAERVAEFIKAGD